MSARDVPAKSECVALLNMMDASRIATLPRSVIRCRASIDWPVEAALERPGTSANQVWLRR